MELKDLLPLEFYATADDLDEPILRDGVVVCFFLNQTIPKQSEAAQVVFDEWLLKVPEKLLLDGGWYDTGGEDRWVKKGSINRLRNSITSKKSQTGTSFATLGVSPYSAPDYQFEMQLEDHSNPSVHFGETKTSYIEMRFPTQFVETENLCDELVDWVKFIAKKLDYTSAYASIALQGSNTDRGDVYRCKHIPELAFRYPGLDIHDNSSSCLSILGKSRGARWLTLLGSSLVETLEGEAKLKEELDPDIDVIKAGDGLMLRASPCPELGDMNREGVPKTLRSIAHAIEPVTYFHSSIGFYLTCDPDKRDAEGYRWERRFWKGEGE